MKNRSTTPVAVRRVTAEGARNERDLVATEEPMEVRVLTARDGERTDAVAITMRTPGHDFELAVGFLLSEGLIAGREDVTDVSYCPDPDDMQQYNIVQVTLAPGALFEPGLLTRNFYTTSSCGVCGKATRLLL